MKNRHYKGSDLGADFKLFYKNESNRLKRIFKEKGCSNIKTCRSYYYFSGFFDSPSGQTHFFSTSDIRYEGYSRLLIREAEDRSDFIGKQNRFCGVKKQDLLDFKIR
jgi:hypothetical protein